MFKSHLKIALRNLQKQKGYSFINIFGLAIGLACCVLIVLFVRDELSYDRHHERADRIFRVTRPTAEGRHWAPIGPPVGPALQAAFPGVEAIVRFFPIGDETVLSVEGTEKRFDAPGGVYADATVFEVFTFPLLRGDPLRALAVPGSVVLSASMAQRLFGEADPVGRTLGLRGPADLTVTGVMADPPATTHLPLQYLVSMRTVLDDWPWAHEARTWAGVYTYLLLRHPDAAAALEAKLPGFVDAFFAPDYGEPPHTQTALQLQSLTSIHLHSQLEKEYHPNSDVLYVYVFGLVALFVLVIASVNFINLTTARSGTRLREVGVRKALGSTRTQLARQFLAESLVMSTLALGAAYTLVTMALSLLGHLTGGKTFTVDEVSTPKILLALVGLTLATGLVSGLYPALYLSGFGPVRALRSDPAGRQPALLRRGLVVFQFALSIFMLAATVTVYHQLRYVHTRALGFDKEHVVNVRLSDYAAWRLQHEVGLDAFKQEIARSPAVASVSFASDAPGERYSLENITVEGEDEAVTVRIAWGVDHDYARTLGLMLVEGRDFSRHAPADTAAWLINESAARELGLAEPLGKVLHWGDDYAGPIVGVVEDFHFASLHWPIEPLVIPLRPGVGGKLLVRVQGDIPSALDHVEAQVATLVPGTPFHYTFLDDTFDQLYRAEKRLGQVFGLFAGLAVVIACLGLFGLAAYTAERRRKEIGVRKVLGASVGGLVVLLSKEFAGLVLVAFAVATPVAYLAMGRWLDGFAYRIEIGPGVFVLAGVLALLIALLTVSYQAVRAALADPVKSLHYE